MKQGNWFPISKALVKHLPKDRPYTELEAAVSLQLDYDDNNEVTVAGYAILWKWSRNKVRRFLKEMGVEILYPDNTLKTRNQKGHITIHKQGINGTYNGHIRLIDSKWIGEPKDIKRTNAGHKRDKSLTTTTYPNPKPNNKKPKTPLPDGFKLDENMKDYARKKGINCNLDDIFEAFCIWHKKNGIVLVDWNAGWQSWVQKHIEFHPQSKPIEKPDLEALRSND